jgi:hypothetical protein
MAGIVNHYMQKTYRARRLCDMLVQRVRLKPEGDFEKLVDKARSSVLAYLCSGTPCFKMELLNPTAKDIRHLQEKLAVKNLASAEIISWIKSHDKIDLASLIKGITDLYIKLHGDQIS